VVEPHNLIPQLRVAILNIHYSKNPEARIYYTMHISRILLTALLAAGITFGAPNIPLEARKRQATNARAGAIKEAFLHSWNGYTKYAFGFDELSPVSNKGTNSRYATSISRAHTISQQS